MPKVTEIFNAKTFLPPLVSGKPRDAVKRLRIRWKNKNGSTESMSIDVAPDDDWIALSDIISKCPSDSFRIESLDDGSNQIGSHTYKKLTEIITSQQNQTEDDDMQDDRPAPAPMQHRTIEIPKEVTRVENTVQAETLKELSAMKIVHGMINNQTDTLQLVIRSNLDMAKLLSKERDNDKWLEIISRLQREKDIAVERQRDAETALAIELATKDNKPKDDPLKSITTAVKDFKEVTQNQSTIIKAAIAAMSEGKTETVTEIVKGLSYEAIVSLVANTCIVGYSSIPKEKQDNFMGDVGIKIEAIKAAGKK